MKKTILLTIFYTLSFLLLTFQLYSVFKESHAKNIATEYIATTYKGYSQNELEGTIYSRDKGTYAMTVSSKSDISCSYFLQVKLTWDTKLVEVIDAFEHNQSQNEYCLQNT